MAVGQWSRSVTTGCLEIIRFGKIGDLGVMRDGSASYLVTDRWVSQWVSGSIDVRMVWIPGDSPPCHRLHHRSSRCSVSYVIITCYICSVLARNCSPTESLAGLYLSRLPRPVESRVQSWIQKKHTRLSPFCVLFSSISIVNCGLGLKRGGPMGSA